MNNNSQLNLSSNVFIQVRDKKTNRLIKEVKAKNMVTKGALIGIARLLCDYFVDETYNQINTAIPSYIAYGVGTGDTTFNTTALDEEVLDDGENIRLEIAKKSISTETDYIQIIMKSYVPSTVELPVGGISELGLFTASTDSNCWARVKLPVNIEKTGTQVIDIFWYIRLQAGTVVIP